MSAVDNILLENKDCPYLDRCNHVDCDKFCMKNYKTNFYFNNAFISPERRLRFPLRIDSDGSDAEAFTRLATLEQEIESFVNEGKNIYIYSRNVGNGKTSWALRLANSYINKVWYKKDMEPIVLFISVPKFLLELKANISNKSDYIKHITDYVNDCDLVIWDDIGTKTATTYESEHLLSMIDGRINAGKANIFSSNLNDTELHDALGDRLTSRICNLGYNIELVGGDKRGVLGE